MKKKKGSWVPNGYIFAALRKICRWSPAYRNCKKAVLCALCEHVFDEDETKLADHIEPVIDPKEGFKDWNTYIQRLYQGKLQALCAPCHKTKTQDENKIRRQVRKAKNE